MVFFISVLRALSSVLITNAHYTGVYPTDLIANGGLLGDVLFFAISGYCLANVKLSFGRWYAKRIIRIYIPTLIITAIYTLLKFYYFNGFFGFVKLFIYPTYYHFIASIIVLYIPFYFVIKIEKLRKRIPLIIGMVFAAEIIVYIFFFDKSYYHIDVVHSYMIRFLFFICMLIGAYIRINDAKYRNKEKVLNLVLTLAFTVLYFASKLFFVHYSSNAFVSSFQILNQVVLIALLYFAFATFAGYDSKLSKLPKFVKAAIEYIGKITLEIYLVQYVIVPKMNFSPFPLNWIIITATILLSAVCLNFVAEKISKFIISKTVERKIAD